MENKEKNIDGNHDQIMALYGHAFVFKPPSPVHPIAPRMMKYTSLHWAAMQGEEVEKIELLIKAGVDVDSRDGHGRTPLHLAASNSNEGGVKLLLQAGAGVNAKDEDGNTALHYAAARTGDVHIAQILIGYGAKIDAKASDGETPLDKAKKYNSGEGKEEIIALLSR